MAKSALNKTQSTVRIDKSYRHKMLVETSNLIRQKNYMHVSTDTFDLQRSVETIFDGSDSRCKRAHAT